MYDSNDILAFVASMDPMNDTNCDSDSDDNEFIDKQRAEFLDNLVVEHKKLIKSYMKNHDVLEAHKNKINVLSVEKTNLLEKIGFLNLNIILSLRRIMLLLKRSRMISLLYM